MTEVAILGAGTMGHALALVYALGGHSVRLTDTNAQALADAPALMASAAATLAEGGEIDASWTGDRLAASVRTCPALEQAVDGAAFIVEAIAERREAKAALFEVLDRVAPPDAAIASNTSHLDVFPLIPERRQARALIMHWYTPPYLVDLVDLVPGPHTLPDVIEDARAMAAAMGKAPVVFKRFVSGYIANRLQEAIGLEVFRLLDEGVVGAEDIDVSVIHGLALRLPVLGVLAKADFTGLELMQQTLANRTYQPPEPTGRSHTLDALIAQGRLGVKSGAGFFDWGGRAPGALFRERDQRLIAVKRAMRGVKPMVQS